MSTLQQRRGRTREGKRDRADEREQKQRERGAARRVGQVLGPAPRLAHAAAAAAAVGVADHRLVVRRGIVVGGRGWGVGGHVLVVAVVIGIRSERIARATCRRARRPSSRCLRPSTGVRDARTDAWDRFFRASRAATLSRRAAEARGVLPSASAAATRQREVPRPPRQPARPLRGRRGGAGGRGDLRFRGWQRAPPAGHISIEIGNPSCQSRSVCVVTSKPTSPKAFQP